MALVVKAVSLRNACNHAWKAAGGIGLPSR
jgi:hypothetical protein